MNPVKAGPAPVQSINRLGPAAQPSATGATSVSETPDAAVTRILRDIGRDPDAANELLPIVYDQLRDIARRRMSGERPDHTLDATALVNEAFVRLIGSEPVTWEDRSHFYAAAAQAMRRILIDHARRRNADKRGGGKGRLPLDVVDLASSDDPALVLAIDEALNTLEHEDPRAASIVRLRFFAGLDVEEVARALDLSERTVLRDWAFARARLFELMSDSQPEPSGDGQ